jgi:hypothetical protein
MTPQEPSVRWARVGITGQFLALGRCLGEYFRLKQTQGPAFARASVEPFLTGALITALFCWLAVTLYFLGRYRAALGVACVNVAVLVAYKILVMR